MPKEEASEGSSRRTKENDPRKHHYVPVFYQRNFVNENGLLRVYDRKQKTYKELHPLVICFKRDFYAVEPEGKLRDMRMETKLLAVVDARQVIKSVGQDFRKPRAQNQVVCEQDCSPHC
jgi:hypothetical protein